MIVIFLVLFFIAKRLYKSKGITPSLFVVATFLVSTIIGIVYRIHMPMSIYTDYNYFSMIYYALNLAVLLFPLIVNMGLYSDFSFPANCINKISALLIVGGIMALIYEIQEIDFSIIAANWSDIRNDYYSTMEDTKSVSSLYGKVGVNFEHVLFFAVPLSFYHLSKREKHISFLLLLVSFSVLFHSLRMGERQSILLWLSYVVMSYLIFKPVLSNKVKKHIGRLLLFSSLLLGLILALITFSRFGEDGNDRLLQSLYAYSGEQPYNAAFFLEKLSQNTLGGKLNFSFLFGEQSIYIINDFFTTDFYLNSFSSIVGSYYKDFGYYTILVSISVSSFFFYLMKRVKINNTLLFLYIYCIYFNMMFVGVFYNKYTNPTLIRNIVIFGIIIYFIELLSKQTKSELDKFKWQRN